MVGAYHARMLCGKRGPLEVYGSAGVESREALRSLSTAQTYISRLDLDLRSVFDLLLSHILSGEIAYIQFGLVLHSRVALEERIAFAAILPLNANISEMYKPFVCACSLWHFCAQAAASR